MSRTNAEHTAPDPWESGELGRDERYVERATPELQKEVEESLELQMISIRLQKALLNDLKFIAEYRGLGYQPLIREVLLRFARGEMGAIARELQEQKTARKALAAMNLQRKKRAR